MSSFSAISLRRITLFCAVLATLIVAFVAAYRSVDRSRTKFIGYTDPATGCRIEYTVSNHYIRSTYNDLVKRSNPEEGDTWIFEPKPPTAVLQWIKEHILRRPVRTVDQFRPTPGDMFLLSVTIGGLMTDQGGYANITLPPGVGASSIQEHTRINGCLVTWYSMDLHAATAPAANSVGWAFVMLVKSKAQSTPFKFGACTEPGQDPDDLRKEIGAIRDSIRIVKVK